MKQQLNKREQKANEKRCEQTSHTNLPLNTAAIENIVSKVIYIEDSMMFSKLFTSILEMSVSKQNCHPFFFSSITVDTSSPNLLSPRAHF